MRWADYLVGCDGGRSVVRKAAGIEYPLAEAVAAFRAKAAGGLPGRIILQP